MKKCGSGYGKLVKCVPLDAAKPLQNAPSVKQEIYPNLQTELVVMDVSMIVAREYHYHKSCRCILLKKPAENKEKEQNSFKKLKDYVQLNIIEKGKVIKMNHIVLYRCTKIFLCKVERKKEV